MNLRKQLSSYIALNNYVEAIRSSQLPAGYTELEYIESTGTQAIDTKIVLQTNNVEFEWTAVDKSTNSGTSLFGSETRSSPKYTGILHGSKTFRTLYYGSITGKDVGYSAGAKLASWKLLLADTVRLYKNDVMVSSELAASSLQKSLPIAVFASNFRGSMGQFSSVQMYSFKILDGGNLVLNLIPAMRNSDNVVGMYDTISGTFFTNSGTGNFVAGPEVYKYSSSIVLTDAITNGLTDLQLKGSEVKNKPEMFLDSVVAKGGTEQNGTPTPDTPMDIVSNNGVLKVSPNLFDKNASYALFNGYVNNVSVGENTTLMAYGGGDKTIIIKVAPNTTYTVTRVTNLGSVYDRIRCAAFTTLPVSNSAGVILCNYMNTTQANATFTTLSDTQYVAINVRNSGPVGDDWPQFVDAFQLEKGSTATQYRPYGQIYTDGTPETVTITGKNLFNESHIKSVAINDISVVIPVKQNKTYTWSYNKTEYDFRFDSDFIWGIDLNGSKVENGVTLVYANGTYATASYVTVTVVSPNVVALQTVFRNNTIQSTKENVLASNMQLEEGIRPTKYEEYYQASFVPEDLLKLGDYQDVQSVLDGIVTRNVGIKVLDGTENWTASSNYFGSCYTYVLGETPVGQVICSHFQNTSSLSDYSRGKCYKETGAFNLWYGDNIATAIADLKQFLANQYAAGTPVIVVYPLANTVEETVESRDVFITSGTNTIERNSEYVSSDGITIGYKKLR